MLNAYLDGYQIHGTPGSPNPNGIYLNTPIKGLGAASFRYAGQDRIGMSGHEVINTLYGERLLPWSFSIDADNAADYYARRRALAELMSAERDQFGDPVTKRLEFTMLDGSAYFMDVVVRDTIDLALDTTIGGGPFLCPMSCPEPQIFAQGLVTVGPITRPSGGGAVLPWILPVILGSSTGGSAIAANLGTIFTWPVITLSGVLTNPYILNVTTGDHFQLQYTSGINDSITIDMLAQEITLNNSTDLLSAKTDDSTWFPLAKGSNALNFSSGSTSDTGTMTVSYYHAFAGV